MRSRWFRLRSASLLVCAAIMASTLLGPVAKAQTARASAATIALHLGPAIVTLRDVSAQSGLSDATLAALFVVDNPAAFAARMAAFDAAELKAAAAEVSFGDSAEPIYVLRDIKLTAIAGGRIGAFSVGASEGGWGRIGGVSGQTLDLGLLARFLAIPADAAGEPETLLGGLFFEGARAQGPWGSLSLGSVAIDNITLRRFATPAAELAAALADPATAQGDSLTALLDLAECCAMGRLRIGESSFAAGGSKVTVESLSIEDFGDWRIGEFKLSGLAFEAADRDGPIKLGMGLYGFSNLSAADSIAYLRAHAADGPGFFADLNARALQPTVERATIADIAVDWPMPEGDGNAENGARFRASLERAETRNLDPDSSTRLASVTSVDHLRFDIPQNTDPAFAALSAMGFRAIDLSAGLEIEMDLPGKALTIKSLTIDAPGMGTARANFAVENFDATALLSKAAMMRAATEVAFKSAALRIEDGGLAGPLLAWLAAQRGRSVEQLRADALAALDPLVRQGAPRPETAAALLGAAARFLDGARSIEFAVSVPQPLGFAANLSDAASRSRFFEQLQWAAEAKD